MLDAPDTTTSPRRGRRSAAPEGGRAGRVGFPRLVWAAVLFMAATSLTWSVAMPTLRSADEYDHVSAAISWSETGEWPGYKELPLRAAIPEVFSPAGLRWGEDPDVIVRPSLTDENATPRSERVSFDELTPGDHPTRINKAGQHPPAYAILTGTVYGALPDGIAFDQAILALRVISVTLITPLPLIAAAIARRLGARRGVIAGAALAVCAVPQLGAFGGAVNNDNLLNLAAALTLLGIAHVVTGDRRWWVGLALGLAGALALLTKAWALPLVAVAFLAYLVAAARSRSLRPWLVSFSAFVVSVSLGAWWWVRNVLVYGTVQPAGHRRELEDGPLPVGEVLPDIGAAFVELFPSRFWAQLSIKYGSEAFPNVLLLVLTAIVAIPFIVGLVRPPRGVRPLDVILLVVPMVMTLAILVLSVTRLTMQTGVVAGVQGRYLYSTITVLALVVALGLGRLSGRRAAWIVPLILGLAALALTLGSVARGLSYHYGSPRWGSPLATIDDVVAWSPVEPWVTIPVWGILAAAALYLLVELVVNTARGRELVERESRELDVIEAERREARVETAPDSGVSSVSSRR
ncbi:glycosyltransferase family 39 protein [Marisediminicola sp. LYQ134]|uniref:glycosyltransferase family 39 protein n=1 Tax=Marisediminicola sp. LYQ134 TaxID=3391061 RepID=UPI0039838B29